jgi:tetratricopeptide (TPR) repeat protein
MNATNRPYSPHFFQCAQLLLKLHKLEQAGLDESKEADDLRDAMDAPWYKLSDVESTALRGLSADLYTIGHDRVALDEAPNMALTHLFEQAVEMDDWPTAIRLIRDSEKQKSPFEVAFLRGVCWLHMGVPTAAVEFLLEMVRLGQPTDAQEIWMLSALVLAGRIADARQRAQEIQEQSKNPLLLMKASQVMALAADELENGDSASLRKAVDLATRALASADANQPTDLTLSDRQILSALRVGTLLSLTLSYDQLGDRDRALSACRKALEIEPNNPNALMLLGWLNHDQHTPAQRRTFHRDFNFKAASEEIERLPDPVSVAA